MKKLLVILIVVGVVYGCAGKSLVSAGTKSIMATNAKLAND